MDDESEMLRAALQALWAEKGRPERDGDDDILGLLVRMMLGQATSKTNASRAFANLLDRFEGNWGLVEAAAVEEVAGSIAVGGLSEQKAPRIQTVLSRALADFGAYTLEPLREREPAEALDYLLSLPGVGPTTARFTLMDAAGMDVFPMNGGIRRVLDRLGVLPRSEPDKRAHELAAQLLPAGWAYAAHMTLVRHARMRCRKKPLCDGCALSHCPAREVG